MTLDQDQRNTLDALDDFTEQTFVSTQYAGLVLNHLRRWKAEGRAATLDDINTWARERELPEWTVGCLAGLALAVQHDDDPEARR